MSGPENSCSTPGCSSRLSTNLNVPKQRVSSRSGISWPAQAVKVACNGLDLIDIDARSNPPEVLASTLISTSSASACRVSWFIWNLVNKLRFMPSSWQAQLHVGALHIFVWETRFSRCQYSCSSRRLLFSFIRRQHSSSIMWPSHRQQQAHPLSLGISISRCHW